MDQSDGREAPETATVETFEEKAIREAYQARAALEMRIQRKLEREQKQRAKEEMRVARAAMAAVRHAIAETKQETAKAKLDAIDERLASLLVQKDEMNEKLRRSKADRDAELARIDARRLLNGSRVGRQIAVDRVLATIRTKRALESGGVS